MQCHLFIYFLLGINSKVYYLVIFLAIKQSPWRKSRKFNKPRNQWSIHNPIWHPKKDCSGLARKVTNKIVELKTDKDSEMNENKIVILTVLLLCSAPMAKPKAMMSKMKTEINTNLEAMDMQLQQIQNSTTTRSTSALCSLLFFFFLLVLTRSFSASISNIQKFTGKVLKKKPMCFFFYFNRK